MKAAAFDSSMAEIASERLPTPREGGPSAVIAALTDVCARLTARAGAVGYEPESLGLVVPGIVDEERGVAVFAANLGWRDMAIRELLGERVGLPVVLGHDVRAGGLAEATFGAAAGIDDVLFVPIGTGIAAAIIAGGQPLSSGGYAGEIGHTVAVPGGETCECGRRGCLETVASARAIARRYHARSGSDFTGDAGGAAWVADRIRAGDPDAREVWEQAVTAVAAAFAEAVTLLGSSMIVVGGGFAGSADLWLEPLRRQLYARLTFQRRPEVVPAALGDRAGCLGAGLLAWQRTEGAEPPRPRTGGYRSANPSMAEEIDAELARGSGSDDRR